ncbi:sugar ABC transporter ATP-binding protein [Vagococcus zengguangii]|uniref:Sugar ABC transporter ATP-binding protein n=1 Tax=Vagococcus zengguangii TaxID=2571750 RepID=A0A4D7CR64_9ENTE|nr:sugar ABC transporter ATP-binding protein [Vagococcus zengguangii]QCI86655.1 sugar ABC transporter ATP-binding protein [Vagococcus zengguangii]TLG79712.1 sugar ABC transporter ATP-binding protein [Vagococcus zengguangii]
MKINMQGISKAFGANKVLEAVDFDLKDGEIHALMGENGAGKSTLMNILTGYHKKDSGSIKIDGEEKVFSNPKEAEEFGITFIHQEMNTLTNMSVLENMFLNKEIRKGFGLLDTKKMSEQAQEIFKQMNVTFDLNQLVGELSVGEQQILEIAKALLANGKIIIMDEPTAALSEREISHLFKIVRKLKADGVSMVYISHRMEEIFELCDRITVMRDGISVSTYQISEVGVNQIVKDMVGRDINDFYPQKDNPIGDVKFKVEDLSSDRVKNISFDVREGEILGFSGLMGAGRTEIMRAIFGIDKKDSGRLFLNGQEIHVNSPSQAIEKGIGFLTENRKEEGLVLDFSLKDNVVLPSVEQFNKKGVLDNKTMDEFVELLLKRLTVKMENSDVPASSLSGGNQQKVVMAKWIGIGPQVLILDEPTRGVDVGAKREIYLLMNELAERGVAIIMVSSDLPEVLGVSDRILVVHEGKINGELMKDEATQERIMHYATGGK